MFNLEEEGELLSLYTVVSISLSSKKECGCLLMTFLKKANQIILTGLVNQEMINLI